MDPKAGPLANSTIFPKGRGLGLAIALLIPGLLLVAFPFVALALRPADVEMTWIRWVGVLACGGLVGLVGAGLVGLGIFIIRHRHDEPPLTDFAHQAGMRETQASGSTAKTAAATYSLVRDKATGEILGLWLADPNCASPERPGFVETLLAKHGAVGLITAPRRIVPNTFDAKGGCFVMFGNQRAPGE